MIENNKEEDLKKFNYDTSDLFGHYANIEMEFYGEKGNQKHLFKIINSGIKTNFYNDVPFNDNTKPAYIHKKCVEVVSVIECGINETKVYQVPLKDIEILPNSYKIEEQLYKSSIFRAEKEISRQNELIDIYIKFLEMKKLKSEFDIFFINEILKK